MSRVKMPEVNAGSMADIAFLLLIFFLVTTVIETDAGMNRLLPSKETSPPVKQNDRNVLPILIDKNGQLFVDDDVVELKTLRTLVTAFLDNGGATKGSEGYCGYCRGERSSFSSDNPDKAVITLKNDRETKYEHYIAVQNELVGAYNDLRNRESRLLYGESYIQMEGEYDNPKTLAKRKTELKARIKKIREMFPLKLIEETN